ncbi:MAG: menaquinone biosynthetic enzyme MqnA/MqnD family protein [Nitrospinota bacterium]
MIENRYRVGIHDFLNSRPFLYPFKHGLADAPFDIVTLPPATLAKEFHANNIDIGLIPSIEYARGYSAKIIRPYCIASLGEVSSVLLYSDRPLEEIESVAIDPKSRTSVVMMQILFKELFDNDVALTVAPDGDPMRGMEVAHAGLIIGDLAFEVDNEKLLTYDLGKLWYQFSGRPFVHALFVTKHLSDIDFAIDALNSGIKYGLEHLAHVIKSEKESSLTEDILFDYLGKRIIYKLDATIEEGLIYFFELASKWKLINQVELKFYE